MRRDERMVLFYDLHTVTNSRTFGAPERISVRRAFQLIEMIPRDRLVLRRGKGTQIIYVSDWEMTSKYVKLLINKSDKMIPDPVFSNPTRRVRRTAAKQVEEGQDFSAHVVIKLPDDPADPGLMLLEQSPGVNASLVLALMNKALRTARAFSQKDFSQIHPDGSVDAQNRPKTYRVWHRLEIEGHPDESFISDLNNGQVQALELVKRKRKGGFDTTEYFKEESEIIVLKPDVSVQRPKQMGRHVLGLLTGKRDYDTARIKFTPPDHGRSRSINVDPMEGIPENYVKKIRVQGLPFDLPSSHERLHPAVLNKMLYLAR